MEPVKPAPTVARTGWFPLMGLPLVAFSVRNLLPAWAFMWILSIAIYMGLKWLSWWKVRNRVAHAGWRSAAYLFTWPGMDAESFMDAGHRVPSPSGSAWYWAVSKTAVGITLFWVLARDFSGQPPLLGWVGMSGLILLLHFGVFESRRDSSTSTYGWWVLRIS